MGHRASQSNPDDIATNANIDAQLRQEREMPREFTRFILLGNGGAGKTTLVRQIRSVFGPEFQTEERATFRLLFLQYLVDATQLLIKLAQERQEPVTQENQERASNVMNVLDFSSGGASEGMDFSALMADVHNVVNDKNIVEAFNQEGHFHPLLDRFSFFMRKNLERMGDSDFIPTSDDLVSCRIKTEHATSTDFEIDTPSEESKGDEKEFCTLLDVGGQRHLRGAWQKQAQNCGNVLYVVSLGGYCQKDPDSGENLFEEALKVLGEQIDAGYMNGKRIFLIMNKTDTLARNLNSAPITAYYPDFTWDPDQHEENTLEFDAAETFFRDMCLKVIGGHGSVTFSYSSSAIDPTRVKATFQEVRSQARAGEY